MSGPPILLFLSTAILLLASTLALRLLYVLPLAAQWHPKRAPKTGPSHMVVVLGSGGHTREMIGLLRVIDPQRYAHRTYIASTGDNFAHDKAREIESNIQGTGDKEEMLTDRDADLEGRETSHEGDILADTGVWDFKIVPRAREIHQPILTTPLSALKCLFVCVMTLRQVAKDSTIQEMAYPDVIVTNGPATAVMVILASYILKFLGMAPAWKMKIIYVESWARVKSLSLSGKILLQFGLYDAFIVQWKNLADKINGNGRNKKVVYMECIVK